MTIMISENVTIQGQTPRVFFAKEGQEAEVIELSPGVNMELDESGKLIGVEVFKASRLFKDVIKLMEKKLQVA